MRIERINENSIRCTLTSFDLSVRNLNIRELAYGTDKIKKLFEEVFTKASNEVGFNVENTPIMIEAIPLGGDSIQFIITKVDDPAELDTRFSKFTQSGMKGKPAEDAIRRFATELLEGANGFFSQLQKYGQSAQPPQPAKAQEEKEQQAPPEGNKDPEFRVFAFSDMDRVIDAAKVSSFFKGHSSLYKRPSDGLMVLLVFNDPELNEDFSKACNVIAEYGRQLPASANTTAYYSEHYKQICADNAIQKLSRI